MTGPTRDQLLGVRPDGTKIFMVAFELCTLLYALVYAFPNIPTGLVDETGERRPFGWVSVSTTDALRDAIRALLRTSDVLEAVAVAEGRRAPGAPPVDELALVGNPRTLSAHYRLNLYSDGVPITTKQMVEALCQVYARLASEELSTREDLLGILQYHQFLPTSFRLRGIGANGQRSRAALLGFCTDLSTAWMQPYFAANARFYVPPKLVDECFEPAAP